MPLRQAAGWVPGLARRLRRLDRHRIVPAADRRALPVAEPQNIMEYGAHPPKVPSPCTGLCRLDAERVCLGCGRRMYEIAAWSAADDTRRREIRAAAAARLRRSRAPGGLLPES